ncbi:MAG: PilN domain-containing protein [Trichodesmium sp. MAG_R03]|nr:PilN domain-containing protein [Trichodesmium sp. MAG_R03]
MYGLDINFLNDRPEYKKDIPKPASSGPSLKDTRPIIIGTAVAIAINGLIAGGWLYLNDLNSQLQGNLDKLNRELDILGGKVKDLKAIKEKTKKFQAEAKALATVFDQIKSWSALLGELGTLVPNGLIITSIEQKEAKVSAPPPAKKSAKKDEKQDISKAPKPTATILLSGTSDSYGNINDFQLLLENSPFFQEKTKLISTVRKPNPTRLKLRESNLILAPEIPELLPIIEYKIETNLSPLGVSELLPELESKGSIGLVERVKILKEKGIL